MGKTIQTAALQIGGMSCANCRSKIEEKLRNTQGVKQAAVSFRTGIANITYDAEQIELKELIYAIESLGYTVSAQGQRIVKTGRTVLLALVILLLYGGLDHFGFLNLLAPSTLANTTMGYSMLFVTGLLTSAHCMAMCGGINLSQSIGAQQGAVHPKPHRSAVLIPTFLYNTGRILSYGATGLILGFIGMLVGGQNAGLPTVWQGMLKILAGVWMVGMGVNMLNIFPPLRKLHIGPPKKIVQTIGKAGYNSKKPFVIGLLNGLMPCGPLQSMQIVALASGNPLTGMLSMLFFGLGTLPLMAGFGICVSWLGKKFTHAVTQIGSVLVVVLGFAMLSQGGNLSGWFGGAQLFGVLLALSVLCVFLTVPYRKPLQKRVCIAVSFCLALTVLLTWHFLYPNLAGSDQHSAVQIIDGQQIVYSTLSPGQYPNITVQAGMPVKWIIEAPKGSINGCNNRMIILDYGIEYTFQIGKNIITFTPETVGTVDYSCWMGMIHGTITVQ